MKIWKTSWGWWTKPIPKLLLKRFKHILFFFWGKFYVDILFLLITTFLKLYYSRANRNRSHQYFKPICLLYFSVDLQGSWSKFVIVIIILRNIGKTTFKKWLISCTGFCCCDTWRIHWKACLKIEFHIIIFFWGAS